ncbi:MAG TPA: hypothetical protein VFV50_04235, partial [Bdellovibrionales bacterium]|nr:hypothetical protein [Bdellovibrionales bacterium]
KEPSRWRFMAAMVLFALAGAVAFSVVALKDRPAAVAVRSAGPAEFRSAISDPVAAPRAEAALVTGGPSAKPAPDQSVKEASVPPASRRDAAELRAGAVSDSKKQTAASAPAGRAEIVKRPNPARPAQPSLPKFGSIRFDVDPDVQIYVNDGWVPPNEFANYPIVVGRHRVRMAKSGYMPIESTVEVTEGKTAVIRARGNQ